MRKKFRFLTVLAVCVMVLSCFSVTAFAYADDTEQDLPVTEATQPEQQPAVTPTPEKPKGEPIDDEGNAYTRDLLYDKATNKQFITVQTKSGNTFFIVIDYDAPINEDEEQYQTYFLNMVDESDLLALLDDDTAAALTTCNCKEKCAAGQVNTDCPVCKTNMSECTGTAPVTPEPDKDAETDAPAPKPEKKSNIGMILVIFVLAGAAGAAYYYIKFVKGRKPKDEDMDFFDDEGYEEEPYINEDDEPQMYPVSNDNKVPSVPIPLMLLSATGNRPFKATSRNRMERYSSFLAFRMISTPIAASSSSAPCSLRIGDHAASSLMTISDLLTNQNQTFSSLRQTSSSGFP